MSTRATYQFIQGDETQTFYVHHDGYEEGAACYFHQMIEAGFAHNYEVEYEEGEESRFDFRRQHPSGSRGPVAWDFIRGNPNAEPTESHEAHGDTEFRYTVKVDQNNGQTVLTAEALTDWESRTYRNIFTGSLTVFVNKHIDDKVGGVPSRHGKRYEYMTRTQWFARADACTRAADHYQCDNPNKQIAIDEVKAIVEMLKGIK